MCFLRVEMRRAEKCTKTCMFKQMLVKDWDAHKVTDIAKEKNIKGGEKKEFRLFTEFIWFSLSFN